MADNIITIICVLILPLSLLLLVYLMNCSRSVTIPIKNRHVFITGGSSGIGLALAHQFAAEGARVSLLARDHRKLEDAKETIRLSTGVDVSIFSADVRDFEAVNKVVEVAGAIDILVCNQGIFIAKEMEFQLLDEIKTMIDANLMGTFHVIKAALPLMKRDRHSRGPASIAIMSSQAGQVGIYGYTAYSATKFALRGLAEALQQEVILDNIHVSLIFPPDTDTPGLLEENKRRPALTSIITAYSGKMKADEIAKISIAGIKKARFFISCNLNGLVFSASTAGLFPQRSCIMAFIELLTVALARLVVLYYSWRIGVEVSKSRTPKSKY